MFACVIYTTDHQIVTYCTAVWLYMTWYNILRYNLHYYDPYALV